MRQILISDPTLRDGSHAIRHQLNAHQIEAYCSAAEKAGIPIVEVGHGNGMGASSLLIGKSLLDDKTMLEIARKNLNHSKLGVHVIPGFATVKKELQLAIDVGVDVFRVACHCTEADTTQHLIDFVRNQGKEVYGALMMTHMATKEILAEEAYKMQSYGADGVVLYDSAGASLPAEVKEKVKELVKTLEVEVGYHAHNNLGMAIANSVAAVEVGATILDGTSRGFGAGAGNTQLEVLVAVLDKMEYSTGIDLYKVLDASNLAELELIQTLPGIKSNSIVSALAGVFSGFAKHVERVSKEYGVDPRNVWFELGKRKVVAGQENLIIEVAATMASKSQEKS
jgi:4-hydroxy 2-oxovalerate aldolase